MVSFKNGRLLFAKENFDLGHIQGNILINECLAKHTTWKVGGPAKVYFQPKNQNDLHFFLKELNNSLPILWLGLGSNVLIRDGGFNGVVINALGCMKSIVIDDDCLLDDNDELSTLVSVEAGATCGKFSRRMADNDLVGAEFLSGIPGTIGGAIAMNAGAFGGECWESLESVETIDNYGTVRKRPAAHFNIGYRQVALKTEYIEVESSQEWFLKGFFRYSKDKLELKNAKQKIRDLLLRRNQTQPVQYANAGSVFKNPPGDYAARLIEACGLKNRVIGDACVSEKHANFIINRGNATAQDIEELIVLVKETVKEQFSVQLEQEVKIIGETSLK